MFNFRQHVGTSSGRKRKGVAGEVYAAFFRVGVDGDLAAFADLHETPSTPAIFDASSTLYFVCPTIRQSTSLTLSLSLCILLSFLSIFLLIYFSILLSTCLSSAYLSFILSLYHTNF